MKADEKLKGVINNRPVVVTALGPSLRILAGNIEFFKDKKACFATLNYLIMTNDIIREINKEVEVFFCCALDRIIQQCNDVIPQYLNFLYQKKRILITYPPNYFKAIEILKLPPCPMFPDNVVDLSDFPSRHNLIHRGGYNSLTALLLCLLEAGVREIYLFGADGDINDKIYYRQQHYYGLDSDEKKLRMATPSVLRSETDIMNKFFWPEVEKIKINKDEVKIYNMCSNSRLNIFPKITMDVLKGKFDAKT